MRLAVIAAPSMTGNMHNGRVLQTARPHKDCVPGRARNEKGSACESATAQQIKLSSECAGRIQALITGSA